MIKKQTLIAAFLFAFTLSAGAAAAQTLRIGLSGDPDTLDPTQTRHGSGYVVRTALCDRLFDIGQELEIVPQLATDWQWTDDRKRLVIKLRPGVKFHDGEPFDAAAVKYNIERHLTMPGSARRSDIRPIAGVEVIDEHTAKIALSAPFAPLLAQLAYNAGAMMSPKAARAAGENFGSHPVCSGPFKFVERVAQERIVLERFADYWDKDKIKVDRIVYLPFPRRHCAACQSAIGRARPDRGRCPVRSRHTPSGLASQTRRRQRVRLWGNCNQRREWRACEDADRTGCKGAARARIVDRP